MGRSQGDGGVLRGGRGPHLQRCRHRVAHIDGVGGQRQIHLGDDHGGVHGNRNGVSTDLVACGGRHGGGAHAHSLHHAAVAHGKHAAVIGEVDDGVGAVAGAHRGRQLLGLAQQHVGRIGAGLNALGRHAVVAVPGQRHGGAGRAMPPASRQSSAAPRARVFTVDFMVRVPLWVLKMERRIQRRKRCPHQRNSTPRASIAYSK